MADQRKFYPFFSAIINFRDQRIKAQFDRWILHSNIIQIRFISALTGILYLISAYLDTLFAPDNVLSLKLTVHLYLLPAILFFITFLTFKERYYRFMLYILTVAPVIAAAGNLVIISKLENPSVYMAELYLILFWIFTVSGLPLLYAAASAVTTFFIVLVSTYLLFDFSAEVFTMHCFWMVAAFSFGFLGAFLLEKSNRSVFCTHLELEELAVTDKLTGLFNRVKLDEFLRDAFTQNRGETHSFGLIILDIDDFKKVNDRYGHLTGDSILVELSSLLIRHLPSKDKAIRWGGEEFMIISSDTEKQKLLDLAERLRRKIQAHDFNIPEEITVSIGVAFCRTGDTVDSIIKRADDALYIAKNSGRNRIEFSHH